MPEFLRRQIEGITRDEARARGPNGAFSPLEQCWHLADLEREGYGVRIEKLLSETDPFLPDFDGDRIARERQYSIRATLAEAIVAFAEARLANLETLAALPAEAWTRAGTQEGVGAVTLSDLPAMMREHDATHRAEIEAWAAQAQSRSKR
jgi:hypothetical protein